MRRHTKAAPAAPTSSTGLRALLAVAALATLALVLGAAPALAAQSHFFQGSVGAGELTNPRSLATDPDGNLYVGDAGDGTVHKYDAAGAPLAFSVPGSEIAVDDSGGVNGGNLYVLHKVGDPGSEAVSVEAFKPNGEPANFSAAAPYINGNAISGWSDGSGDEGSFSQVCGVAVDSNGAIYLGDAGFGPEVRVFVFAPSGQYLTSIPYFGICTPAVDGAGNVYGAPFLRSKVVKFAPDSLPVTAATTYGPAALITNGFPIGTSSALAVDPATDNLYVNGESFIAQYESAANGSAPVVRFGGAELAGGSAGIAIDRSGGATDGSVYAATGGQVDRFGPLVTVPGNETGTVTNVSAVGGAATLNGSVDPSGLPPTECVFEYGTGTAYGQTVPCAETPAQIGAGNDPVAVHADLSGLGVGIYHFRLAARNANGVLPGTDRTFGISGVETLSAREVSINGARLPAKILPAGVRTTYQFEYGTDSGYGSLAPLLPVSAGTEGEPVVSRSISGLASGTTYHYRVVGYVAGERLLGADRTFTTPVVNSPGRAYEQVSPVDKAGAGVFDRPYAWEASPSGDSLAYFSFGVFGDAPSSLWNGNWYRADRSGGGWDSRSLAVPQENVKELIEASGVMSNSEDLSHTVVASNLALTPGAIKANQNFYLRDNETGQLEFIYTQPASVSLLGQYFPGSADYDHLIFEGQPGFAPGATGVGNVYEFTDGHLRVVNRLPNGEVVNAGLQSAAAEQNQSISRDGSRVFFTAYADVALADSLGVYMREDGTSTVPISVSQKSGEVGEVKPAAFAGASADGSVVYFESSAELTDGSNAAGTSDLYRYDTKTDELTDVGADGNGNAPRISPYGRVSVSTDGSYAYFFAEGALTPGAVEGQLNSYVWHEGTLRLLATDPGFSSSSVQISPDGEFAALTSTSPLTEQAVPVGSSCSGGPCRQVFVYDYGADELSCASCPSGGGAAAGDADLGVGSATSVVDSGSVFFDTPERLDPRDQNGVVDVYEWVGGEARLLSAGTDSNPSRLMDASQSGDDVFFVTNDRLVGQDTDNAPDAYDARRGGGIAAQNLAKAPPPCSGEDCQPASGALSPRMPGTMQGGGGGAKARRAPCAGIGARAKQAQSNAKKLRRKAAVKHAGKQRQALERRSKAEAKKATQLQRKARSCQGGVR